MLCFKVPMHRQLVLRKAALLMKMGMEHWWSDSEKGKLN
jgi:hypothetical protein